MVGGVAGSPGSWHSSQPHPVDAACAPSATSSTAVLTSPQMVVKVGTCHPRNHLPSPALLSLSVPGKTDSSEVSVSLDVTTGHQLCQSSPLLWPGRMMEAPRRMLGRPGIRLLLLPALPGPSLASLVGRIRMGPLIMSEGLRFRAVPCKAKTNPLSIAAKRKYLRGSLLRTGEHEPFQNLFSNRIVL